jgi:hypothetical protein
MIILIVICFNISLLAVQDSVSNYHERTDTIWRLQNYAAKEGFIIGIWPHELRIENAAEAERLHKYFGFSHIFFNVNHGKEKYGMLNKVGFPPERIMVQLVSGNFRERVKEFRNVYAFYIDEPYENDLSIEGVREFIEEYSPNSLFITSGYRRNSGLNRVVNEADGVMFSSYKHWWQCLPGIWCTWPVDMDQRPDWTDMKERYGDKSFTNWTGSHRDTLEFYDLLEHASDLNLKGVWLYNYQDPHNSEKNLLKFSDAAWSAGYMHKYERKFLYKYRCYNKSPEDCNWELYDIQSTDEMRKD